MRRPEHRTFPAVVVVRGPIGKLLGAEVLIVSKLVVKGGEVELYAKLVRVETGDVLSVASVRITGGAGLGS